MARSIVGDLIGRKNIVYAPTNRAGVLLLFARLIDEFEMLVEETAEDSGYVIVRRRVDGGWERIKIFLAYRSSEFDAKDVDDGSLLICWHHDSPECPLEAFALKALFENSNSLTGKGIPREKKEPDNPDSSAGASFSDIIPENSDELLTGREATRKRFNQAIDDLDEKIKNFFPDKT
jgi:hypothetical protein